MSTAKLPSLSDGLRSLAVHFENFNGIADEEVLPMTGENGRACLTLLRTLHHLALIQERELGALRMLVGDLPNGGAGSNADPSSSVDGKIVQFPRKSKAKPHVINASDRDPA
ncbi:hypothetical protein KCX83_03730 [Brucella oryzae]|uniref:hypothetical protein n=1 Tax=Brucella oryzae TaxID=335286 RepID=UPI001B839694|nr:hypothetical protein [Brucella oryzae]MBR7651429.1 hypothetical protein [Brucella oryzae]